MARHAVAAWAVPVLLWAALAPGSAAQTEGGGDPVTRGQYVFQAAGCFGCHTDVKGNGPPLAGGRALVTPYGTFYGPNITPDPVHGIGGWTLDDFTRALRTGVAPDGRPYYPAFPYTSFTGMTDADIADLWAYLRTVAPVARADDAHKLEFPFEWRWLNGVWKLLYFAPAAFEAGEPPDSLADPKSWRRGSAIAGSAIRRAARSARCGGITCWRETPPAPTANPCRISPRIRSAASAIGRGAIS